MSNAVTFDKISDNLWSRYWWLFIHIYLNVKRQKYYNLLVDSFRYLRLLITSQFIRNVFCYDFFEPQTIIILTDIDFMGTAWCVAFMTYDLS